MDVERNHKPAQLPQFVSRGPQVSQLPLKKDAKELAEEKKAILCEKLEYLISGFNFVKTELQDQEFTDPFRSNQILHKLENKEYTDWKKELKRRKNLKASQNQGLNEEKMNMSNLGKRKVGLEGIDVEKVLDVMKLRKIENKRMGFWENHSQNLSKSSKGQNAVDKMLEKNSATSPTIPNSNSDNLSLENLLKTPNNWRVIVEEMGESESRLKNVIEVAEVIERWLKCKIRIERGLFNFNPNAFEPEEMKPNPLLNDLELQNQNNAHHEPSSMVPPPPPVQTMSKEILQEKKEIPDKLVTKEEQELLLLRLNIVQCVLNSGLSMGAKLDLIFNFLMRIFEEEQSQLEYFENLFNKFKDAGGMALESNASLENDFLQGKTREQCMLYFKVLLTKAFQLIEQHGQLSEDDISAWISFIYRLPSTSLSLVNHIYRMSKRFKQISIFPEIAEFLPERTRVEAMRLMTKLGSNKILKKIEDKFVKTKEFTEVIAVESVRLFNKLKLNSSKYEDASPEKIKKLISPFFMCLKHKKGLFMELIKDYHKLANPAKLYIIDKFTTILKSVLKSNEIAGIYFEALIIQREGSQHPEDYQALIEAFKQYVNIQGGKVRAIFSDAIVNYVIKTGNLKFLGEFNEDMIIEKVVKVILHKATLEGFSVEQVLEVMETAKLTIYQLLIEIIFFSQQDDSTIATLRKIQTMLMKQIEPINYSKPEFKQMLLLRLNTILPNRQMLHKDVKPVPFLFFPFLIEVIHLLKTKAQMKAPQELFIELVKLLIKARKEEEPFVWEGLVRYCKFDREMAQEKIVPLLGIDAREKLVNQLYQPKSIFSQ